MKILPAKTDIQKLKSNDRKREIDDGVKLARKVDALRTSVSVEEATLTKWRTETMAAAVADIEGVVRQKNLLQDDVRVLERIRTKLQEPIDAAWDDIHARTQELDAIGEALHAREAYLERRVAEQSSAVERLATEKERAADERERARALLEEAVQLRIDVGNANDELERNIHLHEASLNAREEQAQAREEALANTQERITKREQEQDARERILNTEEARVKDLYETLLRNQKRHA